MSTSSYLEESTSSIFLTSTYKHLLKTKKNDDVCHWRPFILPGTPLMTSWAVASQ